MMTQNLIYLILMLIKFSLFMSFNLTCPCGYLGPNCEYFYNNSLIDFNDDNNDKNLNLFQIIGSSLYDDFQFRDCYFTFNPFVLNCICKKGYLENTDGLCTENKCLNHDCGLRGRCVLFNDEAGCLCGLYENQYEKVCYENATKIYKPMCSFNSDIVFDLYGNFKCKCHNDLYTGEYCNRITNLCESNVCLNGGTCIKTMNGYCCLCKQSYTGTNCESNLNLHTTTTTTITTTKTTRTKLTTIISTSTITSDLFSTLKINENSKSQSYSSIIKSTKTSQVTTETIETTTKQYETFKSTNKEGHSTQIRQSTSTSNFELNSLISSTSTDSLGTSFGTSSDRLNQKSDKISTDILTHSTSVYEPSETSRKDKTTYKNIDYIPSTLITWASTTQSSKSSKSIQTSTNQMSTSLSKTTTYFKLSKDISTLEQQRPLTNTNKNEISKSTIYERTSKMTLNYELENKNIQFTSTKIQLFTSLTSKNELETITTKMSTIISELSSELSTVQTTNLLLNACLSNPCKNNGKCEQLKYNNKDNDYKCVCLNLFMGKNCELEEDDCVRADTCKNNSTCINYLGINNYECICNSNYLGLNCEREKNPCDDKPCLNKAKCVYNRSSMNYICNCQQGYYGKYCQNEIDLCSIESKCLNGALCKTYQYLNDSINQIYLHKYKCKCTSYFYGNFCEYQSTEYKVKVITSKTVGIASALSILTVYGLIILSDCSNFILKKKFTTFKFSRNYRLRSNIMPKSI